jgi:hypothetical protein
MQGISVGHLSLDENAELDADTNRRCGGEAVEYAEGFSDHTHDLQDEQSLPAFAQSQSLADPFHPAVSTASPRLEDHNLMIK